MRDKDLPVAESKRVLHDLRGRVPAQSLMEKTLELHANGLDDPVGEALPWFTGAIGELAVAGVLEQLGPGWTVLHSVPVGDGNSDIDHVVIGPAGAFTLNTKNHADQNVWMGGWGLLVSGQKTRYIAAAAEEATGASRRLSAASGLTVPVHPIIVLVRPGRRTVAAPPEAGVHVVSDTELLNALGTYRREFSDEQVAQIAAAAVVPGTWHSSPQAITDARQLTVRFNAILARRALTAPAPRAAAHPTSAVASTGPAVRSRTPASARLQKPASARSQKRASARPSSRPAKSRSRRTRTSPSLLERAVVGIVSMGTIWIVVFGFLIPALQAQAR